MTRKAKPAQRRGKCVSMVVSDDEREQLQAAAAKASMPVSVYLRTMIMMALAQGETISVVRAKA